MFLLLLWTLLVSRLCRFPVSNFLFLPIFRFRLLCFYFDASCWIGDRQALLRDILLLRFLLFLCVSKIFVFPIFPDLPLSAFISGKFLFFSDFLRVSAPPR